MAVNRPSYAQQEQAYLNSYLQQLRRYYDKNGKDINGIKAYRTYKQTSS